LEIDAPVAAAPQHLIDRCGAPIERAASATKPIADLDRPEVIAAAAQYLDREAPAAVEGDGGDMTTYRVAAKLKDFGVSETTAVMLMYERWNHRCSPPWDHGDLARKVANAYRYGASPPGIRAPHMEFGGVSPVTPMSAGFDFEEDTRSPFVDGLRFRPYIPVEDIPPKPWVVHGLLCRGVVPVLAAEGGSGKTGLTVALAAHIAEGKPYSTWTVNEPTRVLVMNGEDSRDELQARMHGVCGVFGFDPAEMSENVQLVPSHEWRVADGRGGNVREHEVRLLADYCVQERIGVIVVDPLRLTHDSDENDNGAMAVVMRAYGALARRANAAVLLIHHAGKARGKSAGDAGASRGASAVVDHSRITVTLVNAQDGDDERYGVPREEMELYARVDDAKQNLARKNPKPRWFKKLALPLPNGDETFVMRPADLRVDKTGAGKHIAETIYREMTRINTAAVTLYHAAQLLIDADPLYANYQGEGKAKVQRVMAKVRPFLREPGVQVWDGDKTALVVHVAEKSGSDVKHMIVIR
ncbi:AAA family ATPase, partial [Phenylobacterium sp.]|uniref:AAA family ATPase n=1 Tax=Phenylobacterium sp. TaxID=1871053 RepID=UPI0025DC2B40